MGRSPPGSSVHEILQATTGVGCHFLLQGIFPTQQLNLRLLHCRQIHSDAPLLFSRSVVSNSVTPWTAARQLICPPPSPRACSNPCALTQCHPTISSSVVPFFSCPQSFPASGFFPMSWLFISDGQSIRTSASASVLSMNIQD